MIFDSSEIQKLRQKYAGVPNYELPKILLWDKFDEFENERLLLESLIGQVGEEKQKEWQHRLVKSDDGQFLGAWFEIRLFGWLKEYFSVQVAPSPYGCDPDFSVDNGNTSIIIEAKAHLIKPEEKAKDQNLSRIFSYLECIKKPYFAHFEINHLGTSVEKGYLNNVVGQWLDSSDEKLLYKDEYGNDFVFKDKKESQLDFFCPSCSSGFTVESYELKPSLKGKAGQHKPIRDAGMPYIIALYIEPHNMSARDVVDAWFGKTVVIVDRNGGGIIDTRTNKQGLHYFGDIIRHKSVSGTLVFTSKTNPEKKMNELTISYIQNPFALNPFPTDFFPVHSRFVVVGKNEGYYEMDWFKN